MIPLALSEAISHGIAALLLISSLLHLVGGERVKRSYAAIGLARDTHHVLGTIELFAAIFLMGSITRIWGVILAVIAVSIAIIALLKTGHYAWTIPGLVMLVALAPASLSAFY